MPNSPVVRALCACVLLFSATSGAATKPTAPARVPGVDQVQATTLANGMKVIVWTDRDIPNVALYNWVRVGSRNEVPGITGLAHFFEHMMFNGTARRTPGEFDRVMEGQGGSNVVALAQCAEIFSSTRQYPVWLKPRPPYSLGTVRPITPSLERP